MSAIYPYLSDAAFLKRVDESTFKEQYVKIIVLDWQEYPIAEIQGSVSAGSISLDGSSAVRRSGNLTFLCEDDYYNVLDVSNLISINKKIKIEVGYANTFGEYEEYDTLWFPQGVFVIINPNITHNNQGLVISISFKDKMCLLNGECGGVLPASVTFSEKEDDNGVITKVRYNQIIRELVSEFGGEQVGKIIINDVPDQIKKVMKWNGAQSMPFDGIYNENLIENQGAMLENDISQSFDLKGYSLQEGNEDRTNTKLLIYGVAAYPEMLCAKFGLETETSGQTITWDDEQQMKHPEGTYVNYFYKEFSIKKVYNKISLTYSNDNDSYDNTCPTTFNVAYSYDNSFKFEPGRDVGYIYTDFCPTSDLIGNAGQNVVTILDTIKKQLGNYEYFYDIDGNFVFQEIRNYLNTSQSTSEFNRIKNGNANGYLFKPNDSKSVYSFDNGMLVNSYQNTPSYANVKNDFIVWGTRETAAGAKLPIRYHVAFDEMPKTGENEYNLIWDKETEKLKTKEVLFSNQTGDYGLQFNFNKKGKYTLIFLSDEISSQEDVYFFMNGSEITFPYTFVQSNNIIEVSHCLEEHIDFGFLIDEEEFSDSLEIIKVKTKYPQTEIYLQGLQAEQLGQPVNHMRYYTELKNEWNKIFNSI